MYREHIHEHADLDRIAIEEGIFGLAGEHHFAVRGRQDQVGICRTSARWIAKELQHEHKQQPGRNRHPPGCE